VIVVGAIAAQGLIALYSVAAGNGLLGDAAKNKYEAQTAGDLSLLQAGRAESLVSTQAIADSPILGHGSWAKDVAYVAMMRDILESRGYEVVGEIEQNTLIPSHSHLLGAWVESGVMGGVFWTAVAVIAILAVYRCIKRAGAPAATIGFILFSLIWDVLFSPFSNAQRFVKAAQICLAISVLQGDSLQRRVSKGSRRRACNKPDQPVSLDYDA
jgi:hypothetical protein